MEQIFDQNKIRSLLLELVVIIMKIMLLTLQFAELSVPVNNVCFSSRNSWEVFRIGKASPKLYFTANFVTVFHKHWYSFSISFPNSFLNSNPAMGRKNKTKQKNYKIKSFLEQNLPIHLCSMRDRL